MRKVIICVCLCLCLCICGACNNNRILESSTDIEQTEIDEQTSMETEIETEASTEEEQSLHELIKVYPLNELVGQMIEKIKSNISENASKAEQMAKTTSESIFETTAETLAEIVETTVETTVAETVTETEPVQEETTTVIENVRTYPLTYSDATCNIEVYQETYASAVVYAAHLTFTDFSRFGAFTGASTVSEAYHTTGAILAINGDYSSACNYVRSRMGSVLKDGSCYAEGLYNANNGIFFFGGEHSETGGKMLSTLIQEGRVTDTFQFGPYFLKDGEVKGSNGGSRRPRTFMGTNGNAGDLWLVVANGDYADGQSIGLTGYECATYLQSKGCTFGIPLDGGGSSEIMFLGEILNCPSEGHERGGLNDFVIFK